MVNKQNWYQQFFSFLSIVTCAHIVAAHSDAPLKISNRTGNAWIWVRINGATPIKIWRSKHIHIAVPQIAYIRVYMHDPSRDNYYQEYKIRFEYLGLKKIKYGLEIRNNSLVYRYIGTDEMKQHKSKYIIKPIEKEQS